MKSRGCENRKMHGAMNGMGRLQNDGWENERDGMSTKTMHGAMNGMGRLRGNGWEDERM